MSASVSPVQVREFAASRSSRRTMRGTAAALAGRKKRLTVVIRNDEGKDEGDLDAAAATGMSSTSAARSRSLTTITRLWSQRSTKVPAMGPRAGSGAPPSGRRGRSRRPSR